MTWSSHRLEINSARILCALSSLGLAALLGLAGCSGAREDGSTDDGEASSAVVPFTSIFKSMDMETLLGHDGTSSGTDKIRSGTTIDYDQVVGNGVVWLWHDWVGGCTAQVVNRWLLLTSHNCLAQFAGATTLTVKFTNDVGIVNTVYSGPVKFGGGSVFGLILLQNGMSTCHATRSTCSSSQRNRPENAVIQFFVEGLPTPTLAQYTVAGYGSTSQNAVDYGVLRSGTMPFVSSTWAGSGSGRFFQIKTSWSFNTARTCPRDDGAPLVPRVQDRILHAGIAVFGNTCDGASGTRVFNAFTDASVLGIFNNEVIRFMNEHPNVRFGCAHGVEQATGLAGFHCDNDGSLYGLP